MGETSHACRAYTGYADFLAGSQARWGGGGKSSSQVPQFQSPSQSFFISYFLLGAKEHPGTRSRFYVPVLPVQYQLSQALGPGF